MSTNTSTIRTINWRPTPATILFLAVVVVAAALQVVLAIRSAQAHTRPFSGVDASIQEELALGERFLNGSRYGFMPAAAEKRSAVDRLKDESKYGGDFFLPVKSDLAVDRFLQESKYGGDVPLPVKNESPADRMKQESKYGG